jgi:hypothetical protein
MLLVLRTTAACGLNPVIRQAVQVQFTQRLTHMQP